MDVSIENMDVLSERLQQTTGLLTVLQLSLHSTIGTPAPPVMDAAIWGIRSLVDQAQDALT